jgi:hypothetical protein
MSRQISWLYVCLYFKSRAKILYCECISNEKIMVIFTGSYKLGTINWVVHKKSNVTHNFQYGHSEPNFIHSVQQVRSQNL